VNLLRTRSTKIWRKKKFGVPAQTENLFFLHIFILFRPARDWIMLSHIGDSIFISHPNANIFWEHPNSYTWI
jgi:hypothetical protein